MAPAVAAVAACPANWTKVTGVPAGTVGGAITTAGGLAESYPLPAPSVLIVTAVTTPPTIVAVALAVLPLVGGAMVTAGALV